MMPALFLARAWLAVRPIRRLRDARRARRGLPPTSEGEDMQAFTGALKSKLIWLGLAQLVWSGVQSYLAGTLTTDAAATLVTGALTIIFRAITTQSLAAKGG